MKKSMFFFVFLSLLVPLSSNAQKKSFKDRAIDSLQDELSSIKRAVRAAAKIGTPQQLTTQERQDLANIGKRIFFVIGTIGVITGTVVGGYVGYQWRKKRQQEAMEAFVRSKPAPEIPSHIQPTREAPRAPQKPLPTPPARPKTPAPKYGWTEREGQAAFRYPTPQ